jgi:hypothetical protein
VTIHGQLLLCGLAFEPGIALPLIRIPQAIPEVNDVVGVAVGYNFIVAVTQDGTAYGMGYSLYGELGMFERQTPWHRVVDDVVAVAVGSYHCIYLFSDGTVGTMGNNSNGQLGNAGKMNSCFLVRIPELEHIICVGAGRDTSAAVTEDGRVAMWGEGGPERRIRRRPRFIDEINDAVAISCGNIHSAIVHRDGSVSTFGMATSEDVLGAEITGWLGHGEDRRNKFRPQKIAGITDAIAVSCGNNHTIIKHADGRVSTFGMLDPPTFLGRDPGLTGYSRPGIVEF